MNGIPTPERATCAECDATVHGSENIYRDPARRFDAESHIDDNDVHTTVLSPADEPTWVCEPCHDALAEPPSRPAPRTPLFLGMSRNGGPRL